MADRGDQNQGSQFAPQGTTGRAQVRIESCLRAGTNCRRRLSVATARMGLVSHPLPGLSWRDATGVAQTSLCHITSQRSTCRWDFVLHVRGSPAWEDWYPLPTVLRTSPLFTQCGTTGLLPGGDVAGSLSIRASTHIAVQHASQSPSTTQRTVHYALPRI